MTKKPSDQKSDDDSLRRVSERSVGSPRIFAAAGMRLVDLLHMSPDSPVLFDQLLRIHQAARHVIGGNLSGRSLEHGVLERLRASVVRQAGDARELQRRLSHAQASEALQEELAEFSEFLNDALTQIERQLGSRH